MSSTTTQSCCQIYKYKDNQIPVNPVRDPDVNNPKIDRKKEVLESSQDDLKNYENL